MYILYLSNQHCQKKSDSYKKAPMKDEKTCATFTNKYKIKLLSLIHSKKRPARQT